MSIEDNPKGPERLVFKPVVLDVESVEQLIVSIDEFTLEPAGREVDENFGSPYTTRQIVEATHQPPREDGYGLTKEHNERLRRSE